MYVVGPRARTEASSAVRETERRRLGPLMHRARPTLMHKFPHTLMHGPNTDGKYKQKNYFTLMPVHQGQPNGLRPWSRGEEVLRGEDGLNVCCVLVFFSGRGILVC